jgi:hypothetical protein
MTSRALPLSRLADLAGKPRSSLPAAHFSKIGDYQIQECTNQLWLTVLDF